jgi:integral membrane protein (TIGR01906 family)
VSLKPESIITQAGVSKAPFAVLVLSLSLSFALLLIWLVLLPSMNQRSLLDLFNRHAETTASGVWAEEYPRLAEAITSYLAGSRLSAQTEVEASDGLRAAFHEHELVHLQDVKNLVDLARKLLFACLTLLLLTVLLLLRGRILAIRPFAPLLIKGLRFAGGALVLLVLTVALWGILDFDGSFTVLHRLAFRNELWLLNPQQDLLIQLMPQPFFEEYALLGLKSTGLALAGLLALLLGENLVNRRRKR